MAPKFTASRYYDEFPLAGGGALRSVRRAEAAEAADAAASLRAAKPTGYQVYRLGDDASVAVGKVYKTYRGALNLRAALKAGEPATRFVVMHVINGVVGR